MTKSRVSRRFKLAALRFRRIPDGLARLRLGCRQWRTGVDWHRAYRVALSVLVIGSPVGLIIYGELTNMPSGVRAPLFAIIAAMALAVTANARADQTWEKSLKWATSIIAIAAVGTLWLRVAEESGCWALD